MSCRWRPRVIGHVDARPPRATPTTRRAGFTLVELLVVIGIIAILVAFLLPALRRARQRAEIVSCGVHMRDFYIALAMYVADWREYPATVKLKIGGDEQLLQGEHGGFMGSIYHPTGSPPGYIIPGIRELLTDRQYTTIKGLQCTATAPGPKFPDANPAFNWSGNSYDAFYCYAGPTADGQATENYGCTSGLFYRAQWTPRATPVGQPYDYSDPHYWGCSVHNRWMRPIATCPSLITIFAGGDASDQSYEPHEDQPLTTILGGGWQMEASAWHKRRRNYLFTDGHVEYIRLDAFPGNNPP
jgi:prepilin-type N-terminal cleavage/methylation domain-containing protein/prepilin-type processing-associated H-X9-DG protein